MNTDAIPSSMYRRSVIPALLLVSAVFAVGCGGSNAKSVDPLDPQADIKALSEHTGIEFGDGSVVVDHNNGGYSEWHLWPPPGENVDDYYEWTVISSSRMELPEDEGLKPGEYVDLPVISSVEQIQSRYAEFDGSNVLSAHFGIWYRGGFEYHARLVQGFDGDAVLIERHGLGNKGNTAGVDDASDE